MIEWKPRASPTGNGGHDAYIGEVAVGWVGYAKLLPDDPPYGAKCHLPGILAGLGNFDTEEKARVRVEYAVEKWLGLAGLVQKGAQG